MKITPQKPVSRVIEMPYSLSLLITYSLILESFFSNFKHYIQLHNVTSQLPVISHCENLHSKKIRGCADITFNHYMYKTLYCTAENVTNVNTFENESKRKYWDSFLEQRKTTFCVFAKPIKNQ